MSSPRLSPLSGGIAILIDTITPTTIHTSPSAEPGIHRGSVVELMFINSNSSSREVTLSDGTASEVIVVGAKGILNMKFWQEEGTTLTGLATGSDLVASGVVTEV